MIAGGSEYLFKFGFFSNTDLKCEADTSKCTFQLSETRISFTRKEIKKHTTKELKAVAVSNWEKNLEGIALKVLEEDGGKNQQTHSFKLNVNFLGKQLGVEGSFTWRNQDEQIGERIYFRDYIFSSNQKDEDGNWVWDSSDRVYWTLPYRIGYSYEYGIPNYEGGN